MKPKPLRLFEREGYEIVDFDEKADVICSKYLDGNRLSARSRGRKDRKQKPATVIPMLW
jgi:hypothetical protein